MGVATQNFHRQISYNISAGDGPHVRHGLKPQLHNKYTFIRCIIILNLKSLHARVLASKLIYFTFEMSQGLSSPPPKRHDDDKNHDFNL